MDDKRPWRNPLRYRLRAWLRWPREYALHRRDQQSREVHPGGEAAERLTGWSAYRNQPIAWPLNRGRWEP